MKPISMFLSSFLVLNIAPSVLATNGPATATKQKSLPLQGHIERKGKFKPHTTINVKGGNPYSISRPYNPNNPPPINNKIHPVSSNAR
jgi:hypothetical protein